MYETDSCWESAVEYQELSSVPCDDVVGWDKGGKGGSRGTMSYNFPGPGKSKTGWRNNKGNFNFKRYLRT